MKEELQALQELIREISQKYDLEYLTGAYIKNQGDFMSVKLEPKGEIVDIEYLEE